MSAADLAERYEVTKATIWRWAKRGNLPAPVKLGDGKAGTVRWSLADIERADRKRARGVAKPTPARR